MELGKQVAGKILKISYPLPVFDEEVTG